jgi:hypothetical protein
MRNLSSALSAHPKRIELAHVRLSDRPAVEETHNPGKGMMWGFLISVILWLVLGGLWAAML